MGVTIKDLAEQLNLSPATISLALNNRPGVNARTRASVLELARQLGYEQISATDRRLPKGSGNIRLVVYKKIGRVVADTPFFLALTEGIEAETRRSGYQLLISHISDHDSLDQVMKVVRDNPKDGIILLATELSLADFIPFFKSGHPLVVLDGSLADSQCDTVLINNFQGAYDAVAELIRQGHRQIGYLRSQVPIYNFGQRYEGVTRALADAQLHLQPEFVCAVEPSIEGAYRGMSDWLDQKPGLPTAFFADNDIIAFGAMKAIKEHNLKIPDDLSIIGFDDLPYCEIIDPPLTTIKVNKLSLGKLAVDRLLARMEDEVDEVIRIEIATELVNRKSVKTLQAI
ncbi:MAG: transcriptional regulator, LacI family [Firmicutes bacterium]|nr:transcriptional regulator, LacI family [Bacillota bacterium]